MKIYDMGNHLGAFTEYPQYNVLWLMFSITANNFSVISWWFLDVKVRLMPFYSATSLQYHAPDTFIRYFWVELEF